MPIKFRTKDTHTIAAYLATAKKREFLPEKLYGEVEERFVQRYFRRNEGTTDGYETNARLIPDPLTHFDVEFELLGAVDPDGTFLAQSISAGSGGREFQLFQNSSALVVVLGGHSNGTTTTLTTGVWRVKFDGVNIEILKDGVGVETIAATLGAATEPSATFTMCARHNGDKSSYGFHYAGVMADVKIRNSYGMITHDYPLNDNSNILANRATSLGQEIWDTTGSFDGAIGTINGESLIIEATVPYGRYEISNRGLAGTEFLINFTVSNSVGDNVVVNTYNALNQADTLIQPLRFGNGDHEVLTNLTDFDRCQFRLESTGNEVTISNISIRRADGYGTIINGNASDWGLFDRQADGDWLGQELLSSNDISAIPWTVTASGDLELGENLIKLTNTMATEAQVVTSLSATIGAKYRVVNTTATSGAWVSSGFEQGRASLTALQNPLETVATSSSPLLRYGTNLASIGGTVTLTGPVSIKEVLKNA